MEWKGYGSLLFEAPWHDAGRAVYDYPADVCDRAFDSGRAIYKRPKGYAGGRGSAE